mmetsp:Transcript_13297/g.45484  ORF Transcript_13297/g.45484 Transcript_13297/m.45484 type:complete len:128 (+) Transcript_13297:1194-1577(+)
MRTPMKENRPPRQPVQTAPAAAMTASSATCALNRFPSPDLMSASSASCTARSLSASSADVASSRSRSFGSRTSARAMATRCFSPPESLSPRSPTTVSQDSSRLLTKGSSDARPAASSRSSSVAPRFP